MANDVNVCAFAGRLTRDAELKYANSGTPICRFSIANNWSKKQGDQWTEEVNFFDCVMFGRRAEALQKYLTKGTQVTISCEARHDRWQDRDGNSRSKVSFVVDKLTFGGSRGDNNGGNRGSRGGGGQPSAQDIFDDAGGETQGDFEDDVPF